MLSKKEIIACIEKIIKYQEEQWEKYSFSSLDSLSPQEMFELGECYLRGAVAPLDFERAYECFEKSASLGCADGYYGLAYLYSFGLYVEQDLEKTHQLVNKAIELGSARALDLLGVCYYSGLGVEVDTEKAYELTAKAGAMGVSNAITNQGAYYGKNKEYDKAYELFEKGLLAGSLNSIARIGQYFVRGSAVEQDIDFGIEVLNYGVQLSVPTSLYLMANIYLRGSYGQTKDFDKAFKYLKLAEKSKYANVYPLLAHCYLNGYGTPQDAEMAEHYISLCEKNKVAPPNELHLANKYLHSLSYIPGNKEKGFNILQKYKDVNNGYALLLLGECYAYGIGCQVSFDMAKKYYERAYECGEEKAFVLIGDCYFYALGVDFNSEKAGEYYLKGKELGIPLAYTRHASLLKYIWERKNEPLVISAYEEAVKQGCAVGMAELGNFLLDKPIKDRERAFELLSEAEKAGEGLAYLGLGKYYKDLYLNKADAKKYFELAVGCGYNEACVYLAEMYKNGELSKFGEKDYLSALYYYKLAKERGYKYKLDDKINELNSLIGSDFYIEGFTLVKCDINSEALVLPYGIKVIGKEAFRGNLKMKKTPAFPASLERIEDRAFMECRKLKSIALPSPLVEYVGADIFLNTFPRSVVYYHYGSPRVKTWHKDYDVIRRFENGKIVRFRPKRGKEKRYSVVGYKKNGEPKLKRIF